MNTLDGKLLLGWMTKEEARTALCDACHFDPAMATLKAEQLWQEYKQRVDALPERPSTAATELPLDSPEQYQIRADFDIFSEQVRIGTR